MSRSEEHREDRLRTLALAALGVVYGDIGTSPLYALRECFHGPHAIAVDRANVLGVLSLVVWSLVVVISIKYLAFVMRADNEGEGGILALMALINAQRRRHGLPLRPVVVSLGLFGAALLYGDGIITPAISVLSAVEGLGVAAPNLAHAVVPTTVAILVGLFWFQSHGTARVGAVFGPVMLVWFAALALLGVAQMVVEPSVVAGVSPLHAVEFFARNGRHGLVILGTVFLVVTGGEALYADMGHFGRRPIRLAWFAVVLPALVLNYFGQGALLLRQADAAANPFYRMAPEWALYPLIALASAATVIASQAVISGSFSLTRQAVQLGYWPRVRVDHTSRDEMGQIYVPVINWGLLALTVALVLGFRSSSGLAAAYGIAVTSTMVITTLLFYLAAREVWGWGLVHAVAICGIFLAVDLSFFGANLPKVPHGGWVPLAVAAAVYLVMATWKQGRRILADRLQEKTTALDELQATLKATRPLRVPGTAVFLTGNQGRVPPALVHNLEHNHVLHEKVVLLTVLTEDTPHVRSAGRVHAGEMAPGIFSVQVRYGFMEDANVPRALKACAGLDFDPDSTTYFLGRETLLATRRPGMAIWREKLFALLSRNARRATAFFRIPPERVFEVGVQVEL